MTTDTETTCLRRTIMKNFLRTLVWIDDEIRPEKTDELGNPFRSFFYPVAQEFQKDGMLVHLYPYVSGTSEDTDDTFTDANPEPIQSVANLSKKADIIILDWHLGRTDPNNSIEILKRLRNEVAIRYIILVSKYDEKFDMEMRAAGDMLADDVTSDSRLPDRFYKDGDVYRNDNGVNIIVMRKETGKKPCEFKNDVINAIYNLMSKTHPDYLHWAALEISGKTKEFTPKWLAALPAGTDLGMLMEDRYEKVGETVFLNLLEDLKHHLEYAKCSSILTGLNPTTWNGWSTHKVKIDELIESLEDEDQKRLLKGFIFFENSMHEAHPKREKSNVYEASFSKLVKRLREFQTPENPNYIVSECIKSLDAFGQFCETISVSKCSHVQRGAIYRSGTEKTILVCISGSCDCLWKTHLMFIEGEEQCSSAPSAPGETGVLFNGKMYLFKADAKFLKTIEIVKCNNLRNIEGQAPLGCLRKEITERLATRFLRYATRVGVNQPLLMRKYRDEDPY